jgi:protein-disulfide isomerase
MRALLLSLVASLGLAACGGPAAVSAPDAIDRMQKAEVEAIVREYLLREPEILFEMQGAYEVKQQMEQSLVAEAAWGALLASAKDDPTIGRKDAAVTIIEFTDYDCGWCKRVLPTVIELADDRRGDTRVVFKELHWQGARDFAPSRAALAAFRQGKYREMHLALMTAPAGAYTPEHLETIARSVGLDIARWTKDMQSEAVNAQIARFEAEARQAGIRGTPGFLINGTFFGGGDVDAIKSLVEAKRAEARDKK